MSTKTFDGQAARFLASVATCMPSLSSDVMQGWVNNPKALQKVLKEALSPPTVEARFLTVLPDLAFENRIKRGNYDWTNSNLTEKRFPVTVDQVGEWEWKFYHFNRSVSSKEAIQLIQEDGFEPAQTGHILTFGEINPEEQRKYLIIGLSSVAKVNLDRRVPGLWLGGDGRDLDLYWFSLGWSDNCRFLGVRRRFVA